MQKKEFDKIIERFFNEKDILSIENFHLFINRKKVIVFVPPDHLEKLTIEMSAAGAGLIGNYEMCSFRTNGTGTFKPNEKAKPFSGKTNRLSYEKEIKLEMECSSGSLNDVINALLKHHPYEETAYEIYDFKKRDNRSAGYTVTFKSKQSLNREESKAKNSAVEFKKLAVVNSNTDNTIIESAKFINCESILIISKKNYKFIHI